MASCGRFELCDRVFFRGRAQQLNVERLDLIVKTLQQVTENIAIVPRELVNLYKGRTTLACAKLASAYSSKWTTVAGEVEDVDGYDDQPSITLRSDDGVALFMSFEKEKAKPVEALQKGESVTVRSQISNVNSSSISFDHCELVKF